MQEHQELAAIYVKRGLVPELATEVARQLMDHDALGAHAKDELGISVAMTLGFLAISMAVVAWIFKTGYRLKN